MNQEEKLIEENARLKAEIEALELDKWRFERLKEDHNTPPMWDLDCKTNVFYWTDQFRHLLGYDNEKDFPNVLESWSNRLHPHDKDHTLEAFAAHMNDKSGKTPYAVYYQILPKQYEHGSPKAKYMWVYANGEAYRDAQGNPERVFGTAVDKTEEIRLRGYTSKDVVSYKGITIYFDELPKEVYLAYHAMYSQIGKNCKLFGISGLQEQLIIKRFHEELLYRYHVSEKKHGTII